MESGDTELKKKLEILEKECEQLKTKIDEDNVQIENLLEENKRLDLKSAKRLPLTNAEKTYVEKNVLEDKLKRSDKKLKDALEKLKKSATAATTNSIDHSSNSEKDSKISELQSKIDELNRQCDQLTKEIADLKSYALTDRVSRKPKDTTPKSTLVKWVSELDDECSKFFNFLLKFFFI